MKKLSDGVPELEPHCGSWIIVDRNTGRAVLETFSRRTAAAINQHRYEVLTALQWLGRVNALARQGAHSSNPR